METKEQPFVVGFTDEVFGQHSLGVAVHDMGQEASLNKELGEQGIEIIPYDYFFSEGEVGSPGRNK